MSQQDVTFRIDGISQLRRALEKLDDEAREDFKEASVAAATIVADEARRQVPVRSGRLRKSIRPAKVRTAAKVYAGSKRVPYAPVIHFGWGTRNIKRNQFLYRAVDRRVDEAVDAYLAVIAKTWNREVKRGG